MLLLIDNYDSFVYNLARYTGELGYDYLVKRNDQISIPEIRDLNPSHIIISPGPCAPDQAGISLAVIKEFAGTIPILGVCLGHQAIAQTYGGKITRARYPLHGKASAIFHDNKSALFKDIPHPFMAGRYHSLIVSEENFPEILSMTARDAHHEIMALEHKNLAVFGVQFHPESILTHFGYEIIRNFLTCAC